MMGLPYLRYCTQDRHMPDRPQVETIITFECFGDWFVRTTMATPYSTRDPMPGFPDQVLCTSHGHRQRFIVAFGSAPLLGKQLYIRFRRKVNGNRTVKLSRKHTLMPRISINRRQSRLPAYHELRVCL